MVRAFLEGGLGPRDPDNRADTWGAAARARSTGCVRASRRRFRQVASRRELYRALAGLAPVATTYPPRPCGRCGRSGGCGGRSGCAIRAGGLTAIRRGPFRGCRSGCSGPRPIGSTSRVGGRRHDGLWRRSVDHHGGGPCPQPEPVARLPFLERRDFEWHQWPRPRCRRRDAKLEAYVRAWRGDETLRMATECAAPRRSHVPGMSPQLLPRRRSEARKTRPSERTSRRPDGVPDF